MKHYAYLTFSAAAGIIILALSACSGNDAKPPMRTEIKSYAPPLIEQLFGPSTESVLLAIRRFAGEDDSPRWPQATNIVHIARPSSFTKSVSPPMPPEEWKSIFWAVEGDWMPPMERPAESNLCPRCRHHLAKPHGILYLYRWLAVEKSKGAECPVDGLRFGFKPLRFAKCKVQTHTITLTSKSDPSRQTKYPKFTVECLALCRTWEELESSPLWKEEQERRATFERWLEEQRQKEAETHPAVKPQPQAPVKPALSPSACR